MGEKLLFFILLLGVLVTVHELGHFGLAKLFGVQVFKFSVGFGPELIAFQLGETRYAIAVIPLGGFVRMAGEDDLVERWGGPDAPPTDPARVLTAKPLWQRALIILAGPLANLLLPALVFSFSSCGESQFAAPVIGTVLPDTPAEQAGLLAGDRIVAVDGEPVAEFADIAGLVSHRAGEQIELSLQRDGRDQTVTLTLNRSKSRDELQQVVERGRIGVGSFRRLAVISSGRADSPAARAGLQGLDRVLRVDGREIDGYDALEAALHEAVDRPVTLEIERREPVLRGVLRLALPRRLQVELPAAEPGATPVLPEQLARRVNLEPGEEDPDQLARTRAAALGILAQQDPALRGLSFAGACLADRVPDSPVAALGLERGDCLLAVDGRLAFHWSLVGERLQATPTEPHTAVVLRGGVLESVAFRLQQRDELLPLRRGQARHLFGEVQTAVLGPGHTETVVRGPVQALLAGLQRTVALTGTTVAGMGLLFTGKLPFASVGGPMMLFDLAGKTSERGFGYFFFIMAFISINLAVLNLLPVPVLDGGHLLFILVEAVRRRPLPPRAAEIANLIGLSLLLMLMLAVMSNDVARYWDSILSIFK